MNDESPGFDRRTFLRAGLATGIVGGGLVLGMRLADRRAVSLKRE